MLNPKQYIWGTCRPLIDHYTKTKNEGLEHFYFLFFIWYESRNCQICCLNYRCFNAVELYYVNQIDRYPISYSHQNNRNAIGWFNDNQTDSIGLKKMKIQAELVKNGLIGQFLVFFIV